MTSTINKVLLVEDNPGDALLLREALKELGGELPFELIHVTRLEDALRRVKAEPFDAILLDLSLPDASGVETVTRMQEETPRSPVVVLTGLDDDAAALEAVRAGAQDYLVKGQIDGRLLFRALSYAIERKRTQEEIERHLRRIVALKDINVALTATLDLGAVLKILLEKVGDLMPESSATVWLWNDENDNLEQVSCHSLDENQRETETARAKFEGDFADAVFRSKTLLIGNDLQKGAYLKDPEFFRSRDLNGYLGIPLLIEDQALGVLSFRANDDRAFSAQETEFLGALASQASVAIRNSQVHGQVRQLADHLEHSNRIKEEFLGVISHELRTPLNVVKGYVELLQSKFFGELSPQQVQAVDKIAVQTKDQLAMINTILHAISIESDVAIVRADEVSVPVFLDELQSSYFSPPDKQLVFQWHYAAEFPLIRTDKTKLRYILQNLINNAVKFTSKGQVTVSAAVLDANGAGPNGRLLPEGRVWLRFDVADTGIGISKDFLPVIFEKFSQVDSSTTRVHGGIGLGLHIAKRCAELLEGTISVDSEPEKGSKFSVMIPCELQGEAAPGWVADGARTVEL